MRTPQRLILLGRRPVLRVLTLSASTVAENAAGGTVVGLLIGRAPGSTLTIVSQSNANWFALSGASVVVGASSPDFETNASPTVTVRETFPGSYQRDTILTLTVTNVLEVTLAALSLDDLTIAEDQVTGTKVGSIINASPGSTVTLLAQSNAGMFAKDGNDIEVGATPLDFETVPSPTVTLRETHADASNSPRDTVVTITVTDVAEGPSLGPELIVNGDMSSDTGWTLDGGDIPATIAGGKMTFSPPSGEAGLASQSPALGVTNYRLVFTIDSISGVDAGVTGGVGGAFGTQRTTSGTFSEDILCDGADSFLLFLVGELQLDNVSLKEIL
jgi:hypothetical protein